MFQIKNSKIKMKNDNAKCQNQSAFGLPAAGRRYHNFAF